MSLSVQDHNSEIEWKPEPQVDGLRPDDSLLDWLTHRGLLSERIRNACDGGFGLKLLGRRPGPGYLLHEDDIRRVILQCGETSCVYAESHMPESALSSIPKLRNLGRDPLGETLQASPDVHRGDFEFAIIDPARLPADVAEKGRDALWARRSQFRVGDSYLTVAEVFLPGIALY